MARNPAAQTAFGPMVQVAVEQYEPPHRRLVDDDLAAAILPEGQRAVVRAMRWPLLRRLTIALGERTVPGAWTIIACRKRFIDDKLAESLSDIDAVVILGSGMDTRGFRLARRSDIPVFEVDLPVNIARKKAAVQRAITTIPTSVHLVPLDFERDDLIATLAENGYRTESRTFFVWEGVTQYLTEDAVRATLAALEGAPAGAGLSSPMSATTSSTAPTCTARRSCTSASGSGSRCGSSASSPTRSMNSSAHTAGDWSNRPVPTTTRSTTFDRRGVISRLLIWSGRRTARSADPMRLCVQFTNAGMLSQPLTVEDRDRRALSMSMSHVGNRFRTSSRASRPSSRANGAPTQKWAPRPNVRWPPGFRRMLKLSGSSKWRSSRLAEANISSNALPLGTVWPWNSTSASATYRATWGPGGS